MEDFVREVYGKFFEYCLKEVEEDLMWWKYVVEVYEYFGEIEKVEEVREKYEEYR